jgi:hypothetical protein
MDRKPLWVPRNDQLKPNAEFLEVRYKKFEAA